MLELQSAATTVGRAMSDDEVVAVFEAETASLQGYVRSMVRDPDEAADVCQEVFVRLLLAARGGQAPKTPAPWLRRVAHNLVVSAARHRAVAERTADRLVDRDPAPSTEEAVVRHERNSILTRALGEASAADRSALVLAAQGFRGAEIAAALGRTELATRALLCRARGRLRMDLEMLEAV